MKTLGVVIPHWTSGYRRLFHTLGESFGLNIKEMAAIDERGVDALVIMGAREAGWRHAHGLEVPSFVAFQWLGNLHENDDTVAYGLDPALPEVLRGRSMRLERHSGYAGLALPPNGAHILATIGGRPIWCAVRGRGKDQYLVSIPPPELAEAEIASDYLNSKVFLPLLPIFCFLRSVVEDSRWKHPTVSACLMFDDPNLHWPTYGYIDFVELAKHAAECNYHVAAATIPLDTWLIHRKTADIFKQHGRRLSLLVHGNDHLHEELARKMSNSERKALLACALKRIGTMEERSGLRVARVMAPPHGACSEEMLEQMAAVGYEGATISRGSLRYFNPGAVWSTRVGLQPAEWVGGLPVFLRFRMSRDADNDILLAALLRQPIIPVGHHGDVADGLEILAQLSAFINGLGEIKWGSMSELADGQYSWFEEGDTLILRMYSRRIQVTIPERIKWIKVEPPADGVWNIGFAGSSFAKGQGVAEVVAGRTGSILLPVAEGSEVTVVLTSSEALAGGSCARYRLNEWAVVRRLLTEGRDRLSPNFRCLARMMRLG